ncbi:hypothetical protein BGW80DRAFT_1390303 [Lactifluus volemus]|nr:hypothetical protein BGW80DRAFT_1390303 [Lactifluus volemus]
MWTISHRSAHCSTLCLPFANGAKRCLINHTITTRCQVGRAYPDISAQALNYQVLLNGQVQGVDSTRGLRYYPGEEEDIQWAVSSLHLWSSAMSLVKLTHIANRDSLRTLATIRWGPTTPLGIHTRSSRTCRTTTIPNGIIVSNIWCASTPVVWPL